MLTKQKIFKDKARIRSNSGKLTNWLTTGTSDQPVLVNEDAMDAVVIREEDDDDPINLADIPEGDKAHNHSGHSARDGYQNDKSGQVANGHGSDSDESALFVPGRQTKRSTTNRETIDTVENAEDFEDNKKTLGMNTSYDGFSIYGRILCLVVKRRGVRASGGTAPASSQQMLENWVSTQAAADQIDDDEDAG